MHTVYIYGTYTNVQNYHLFGGLFMYKHFIRYAAAGVSALMLAATCAYAEVPLAPAPDASYQDNMVISPADNASQAPEEIVINGTVLANAATVVENDVVLFPLRAVCEQLGFTVEWDGASNTISLDNGEVKTTLTIGLDSYYKQSSQAIGLTAPFSYGAAPTLIDDTTYVPCELLNLLYSNPDTAKIQDNALIIQTK